jgi:hypothetical protein
MGDLLPIYFVDFTPLHVGDILGPKQSFRLESKVDNVPIIDRKLFCFSRINLDFEVPVKEDYSYDDFFVTYPGKPQIKVSYTGDENLDSGKFELDHSHDMCNQFFATINSYVDIRNLYDIIQNYQKPVYPQNSSPSNFFQRSDSSMIAPTSPLQVSTEPSRTPRKAVKSPPKNTRSGSSTKSKKPVSNYISSLPVVPESHTELDPIDATVAVNLAQKPTKTDGILKYITNRFSRIRNPFISPFSKSSNHRSIPSRTPFSQFLTNPLPEHSDIPYFHIHHLSERTHIIATEIGQMEFDSNGISLKQISCYFTRVKYFTLEDQIEIQEISSILILINTKCETSYVEEDCNTLPVTESFLDADQIITCKSSESLVIKLNPNKPSIDIYNKAVIRWSKNSTQLTTIADQVRTSRPHANKKICRSLLDTLISYHTINLILHEL